MVNFLLAQVGWGTTPKWVSDILQPIINVLDSFLLPVIIILGVAGMIYGIVLGVKYAKAETADQRDENKKRMIHAVIGILIMLVILIAAKVFTANADTMFGWVDESAGNVVVTIEIGDGKQTKENAATILVNLKIYKDAAEASDAIGDQTRVVVSLSKQEWEAVTTKPTAGNGVTIKGAPASAATFESEFVTVDYSEELVAA